MRSREPYFSPRNGPYALQLVVLSLRPLTGIRPAEAPGGRAWKSGVCGEIWHGGALEAFPSESGIRRLSASTITGNVFVFYNPKIGLREVIARLEEVVRRPRKPVPRPVAKSAVASGIWDGLSGRAFAVWAWPLGRRLGLPDAGLGPTAARLGRRGRRAGKRRRRPIP
jgi:hypothetical protein